MAAAAVVGSYSALQRQRLAQSNVPPSVFQKGGIVKAKTVETQPCVAGIPELFPNTYNTPRVILENAETRSRSPGRDPRGTPRDPHAADASKPRTPLRVGVVLSGGQAPGGHNVIAGIFDYIKTVHPDSALFGFRDGPHGVFSGIYSEVDSTMMNKYRNTGGFDMLGSGRHKIESPEQFESSVKYCAELKLDGLVVIGGDDSNTNASLLAEEFKKRGARTNVIGCPKTIDGDLKNDFIPISFGFDTACRTYSEQIGNLARDALASQKYYHFARLMGRSASHIALEVALQTRPNVCLIGEEVQALNQSLSAITTELTDVVEQRAATGRNYGIILLPEGLVEFIPEIGVLIKEINDLVSSPDTHFADAELLKKLTPSSSAVFTYLPEKIRHELLLDRDPHGNVQVTKIETEQLLAICVQEELTRRFKARGGKGSPIPFTPMFHSFGYEGRSGLPSDFDAEYCYSLGLTAAGLVSCGLTSLMSCVDNLLAPVSQWRCGGVPITMMMALEKRSGKMKPVITKALVKLEGRPFQALVERRSTWALNDLYRCPGPVQFYAPEGTLNPIPLTLQYEILAKTGAQDPDPSPHVSAPTMYKVSDGETFLLRSNPRSYLSDVERWRQQYSAPLPALLQRFLTLDDEDVRLEVLGESQPRHPRDVPHIQRAFPCTFGLPMLDLISADTVAKATAKPRIGVAFAGRQAPGGHNVIAGLHAAVKACNGVLFGFVGGTKGLLNGTAIEITEDLVEAYKNTGSYDMLGRTVDKLNDNHLPQVMEAARKYSLSGIVVVGSAKTMTNLSFLAEKLTATKQDLVVVGVPAGIDGALQGPGVEASIGFDTACNGYAQLVGNTATDAASARKYYHLLRVMGTERSQMTLEVALRTHPNIVILGEEVEHKRESLSDLVREVANVVARRAEKKKNFGVVLIPEGLASAIPELRSLTDELSAIYREKGGSKLSKDELSQSLSPWNKALLSSLPKYYQDQLLLEQANAAIQLSQIETEKLVLELVEKELEKRAAAKQFKGKFSGVTNFLGYQARGAMPSNFDCELGYTLGVTAGCLVREKANGYLAVATGLKNPTETWRVGGIPLTCLLVGGQQVNEKAHVPAAKVVLSGPARQALRKGTESWEVEEEYENPGPCQFAGPTADSRPETLTLQNDPGYLQRLSKLQHQFAALRKACRPGCPAALLGIAAESLQTLEDIITLVHNTDAQL